MRKLLVLEAYVKTQDGFLHQKKKKKKALAAQLSVCADALGGCASENKAWD